MWTRWTTIACAMCFLTGCADWFDVEERPGSPAQFKDVQRQPPKIDESTVDYLIENERPFAGWLAETLIACEEHGCRP
ncbi:hypothetical protein RIdsm_03638 [Roseovarius indicus]|uniref:Lipoprotein n=2 Tax=Roseovarius indicus TaxID=540747 RepID=A0A5P3AHL3_9RHOB|nr:hypothetical protein RIdsm_03638 [Roseovarius indicus]SFE79948.1 hypothetical protein SAMN04488031_12250 [Roseovarius indicus]